MPLLTDIALHLAIFALGISTIQVMCNKRGRSNDPETEYFLSTAISIWLAGWAGYGIGRIIQWLS